MTFVLHKFDLGERKANELMRDVADFDVSRDGGMLLYRQQGKWTIAPLGPPPPPDSAASGPGGGASAGAGGALNTDDIQVQTDPRAEWAEMYHESFRLQRAYFYDPNYHGLDLDKTEKFYQRYVDGLGGSADLDYLLEEVFGNLTVGHLFVRGPNETPTKTPPNGLLGADYTIANDRWRFAKIYAGENWNPSTVAPLTQPGVNVRTDEYLLAVDGRPLTAKDNVDQALEGTAGKSVVLRVGPKPDGSGARDVTVVPLPSEVMLRHLAWIDHNRRVVDSLSGGKLGYIYVPNTANEGYTRFNRYFFAQQDKLGAVVDERFNGGGNIADYMVEYLGREAPFNWVTSRYGEDVPIPAGAIYGPKAMLINEYAGSGGDELPWLFRRFKIGPLIGTRTWGGLVGIGGYPPPDGRRAGYRAADRAVDGGGRIRRGEQGGGAGRRGGPGAGGVAEGARLAAGEGRVGSDGTADEAAQDCGQAPGVSDLGEGEVRGGKDGRVGMDFHRWRHDEQVRQGVRGSPWGRHRHRDRSVLLRLPQGELSGRGIRPAGLAARARPISPSEGSLHTGIG